MDHLPNGDNGSGGEIQQRGAVYSLGSLAKRQIEIVAIPTTYNGLHSGPPPGTVVGIVLGSVAGFLLIIWLLYTCTLLGGNTFSFPWGGRGDGIVEEEVIRRRSRWPRHSGSSRSETTEALSVHGSPSRRGAYRRETIVVEERMANMPAPPLRSKRTSGFAGPGKLGRRSVGADREIGGVSKPNETMVNQSISC
jgi:hypothetical protein